MTGIITDAQLVEQYQKLAKHVATAEAALEAELKPYKEGMEIIKNAFMERFNERGSTNSKTEFGTPYKSTLMNVKVVARDTFLKFCVDNWNTVGSEMLNVAAVKAPVEQFIEKGGLPEKIGVEVSFFSRVNMPKG